MSGLRACGGALACGCALVLSACDAPVDLGRDLDAGHDALEVADFRFACAAGSAARAPLLSTEDVKITLRRRWAPCAPDDGIVPDHGYEFVDDGTTYALRHASPAGPWVRDIAIGRAGYDVFPAAGAESGRWAFQITTTADAGHRIAPLYGYFTIWPLRLVLSDGHLYAPVR